MSIHSKHYYEKGRNEGTLSNTWKNEVIKDKDGKWSDGSLNAKIDYEKDKIPNYYIGKVYGYEARKVIEDFDLSYNVGTATTYLLRAKRKHTTSVECIQKAINHLEFELDKIKNEETDI
jgi:hypothetical protein